MATKGPWELISEAEGKEIGGLVAAIFGGIILSLGQGAIQTIQAGFSLFIDPVIALVDGSVNLVEAIWGGWVGIIEQGMETSLLALAPDSQWAIGPFTQAVALLSLALGLYIIAMLIAQRWTSNLVPGILVDNRFVNWIATTPEEEAESEDL